MAHPGPCPTDDRSSDRTPGGYAARLGFSFQRQLTSRFLRMSQIQVLYVDDEPDIREVGTISLQLDRELEVRAVDSGTAALAVLRENTWAPQAILLDVMMPGLDGPQTLLRIRELAGYRQVPVVFITARAQAGEQERLRQLGAVGVITKPFDPLRLASELRGLLHKAAA